MRKLGLRASILMIFVYAMTMLFPLYQFVTWGKTLYQVLLIPLLLQVVAYVFWFKKIKPWVVDRAAGDEEQDGIVLAATSVFLAFCLIGIHFLVPYYIQDQYPLDNRTILSAVFGAVTVWSVLFLLPLRSKLLHCPEEDCSRWGKVLPFTLAALFVAVHWAETLGRNTAVALVAVVFTLECVAAFAYDLRKHKT